MTAILKIKAQDLTPQLIKDIQEKYADRDLEISVSPSSNDHLVNEDDFWEIIDLLDWSKTGDNNAVLKPAIEKLASYPIHFTYQFQDFLSEKLFQLDGRKFAENIGEDAYQENKYFSPDQFLYARCCVVANGKSAFNEVLENPSEMPKNMTFEPILYLANKAYHQKTGKKLDYLPLFNFETYANEKAWKN